MKKMKKQFAALAMAAALGASIILSSPAVQAKETDPAAANIQENVQDGGQRESGPEDSITQESGQTSSRQEVKKETVQREKAEVAEQTEGEGQKQESVPNSVQSDINAPAVMLKAATVFIDSGEAEAAVRATLEGYGVNNETTVEELREFLEKEFVETGKLKAITADIISRTDADTENTGSVTVNIHMTPVTDSQVFGLYSGFDINVAIPRLTKAGDIDNNKGVPIAPRAVGVVINETNFPDQTFRKYVAKEIDKDYTNSLEQDEIDAVTEMKLARYPAIDDLKGIEYFTALTYLDCHGTGIQALDVRNNLELKTLWCYNTEIKDLDVSENRNLETLYCYNTEIKDLDVRNNLELKTLWCYQTEIKDLNVDGNSKLISLSCHNTDIQELVVSGNRNLETLDCHDTGIRVLDVSGNLKLETLDCHNTRIEALHVRDNHELTYLDCTGTGIPSLDVSGNPKLTNLYCSDTGIPSLDVSGNPKLTYLKCYDTGIQALDVSGNPKLKYLDCLPTPLAWLNVGDNENLFDLYIPAPTISLTVTADTFNIEDKFHGIDPQKVTITDNGSIDPATGDVSSYDLSRPMTYTYDCGTAERVPVTLNVKLNLKKSESKIIIESSLDKEYTGKPYEIPEIKTEGSKGELTFAYSEHINGNYEPIATAPTNVGKYAVHIELAEDEYNEGAVIEREFFEIRQAHNSWINEPVISDWNFGDGPNAPTATAKFGDVAFTYSDSKYGTFTDKVPTNAGTWYVKATVAGAENYTGLESIKKFTISQATNEWIENLSITGWTYGDEPNTPTSTARFGDVVYTYSDSEHGTYTIEVPTKAGTWYVKASVEDTENYTGLEDVKKFSISKKGGKDSPKPDNPKDDPKPDNPKDVSKDAPKGSDTRTGGTVQTGDNSRTGLIVVMAVLSAGSILLLAGKKRKKHSKKS